MIRFAKQLLIFPTMPIYDLAPPIYLLINFPQIRSLMFGLSSFHAAYLLLPDCILVFQGLEESLHAFAQHTIYLECIAPEIRQHISRIFSVRLYVNTLAQITLQPDPCFHYLCHYKHPNIAIFPTKGTAKRTHLYLYALKAGLLLQK